MIIVKNRLILLDMLSDRYVLINRGRRTPIEFQTEIVEESPGSYNIGMRECKFMDMTLVPMLSRISQIDLVDNRFDYYALEHTCSVTSHMKVAGIRFYVRTKPGIKYKNAYPDARYIHLTIYAWPNNISYSSGRVVTVDELFDVSDEVMQTYYGVRELSEPLPGTIYFE